MTFPHFRFTIFHFAACTNSKECRARRRYYTVWLAGIAALVVANIVIWVRITVERRAAAAADAAAAAQAAAAAAATAEAARERLISRIAFGSCTSKVSLRLATRLINSR
jgi:hypothetical protein